MYTDVANWKARLGGVFLMVFAFSAFLDKGVANAALALLVVMTIADWRAISPTLRSDPLPALFAWSTAAAGISAAAAAIARPEEAAAQFTAFLDVVRLWSFIAVAWWTRGRQQLVLVVLLLAVVGFTIGTLRAIDSQELHALLQLERPNFRWSINAIAEYSGAGVLGIAMMTPRLWRSLNGNRWRWAVMSLWACLGTLLLLGLFLSLSRGVWLSFLVVIVGMTAYVALGHLRARERPARAFLLSAAAFLAMAAATLAIPPVKDRLLETVRPFVELHEAGWDLEAVHDDSFRLRGTMLVIAYESFRSSPWFGSGPAAPKFILQANKHRLLPEEPFPDFHSLAMDLLVGLGLIGTLPLVLVFAAIIKALGDGLRTGCLDRDVYLLLAGLMFFNILTQMTDTRLLASHGHFFLALVAGCAYACRLADRAQDPGRRVAAAGP